MDSTYLCILYVCITNRLVELITYGLGPYSISLWAKENENRGSPPAQCYAWAVEKRRLLPTEVGSRGSPLAPHICGLCCRCLSRLYRQARVWNAASDKLVITARGTHVSCCGGTREMVYVGSVGRHPRGVNGPWHYCIMFYEIYWNYAIEILFFS